MNRPLHSTAALFLVASGFLAGSFAADQPQWGEAWSRNMVSGERGLPATFDIATGRNVKWQTEIGTEAYSSAIVASGRVYIGTNNGRPKDPKHDGDRGVLLCLEESSGRLLWQLVVPKRVEDIYFDWPNSGICSPPTVEGDRVYVVDNRGEVLCLDALGLSNGNQGPFTNEAVRMAPKGTAPISPGPLDADILWRFDLTSGAGIWSHDAAHSSIVVGGNYLFLNSGTGVDNTHRNIRTPDAPSLVVIDKRTGRLVARDGEAIAPNIFHATWSAPSMGRVNGQPRLFLAAGNGVVYGFDLPAEEALDRYSSRLPEAPPLRMGSAWRFDFDPEAPKTNVHKYNSNRREGPSDFFGMPVFHGGRIYVAGGGDIWWGKTEAWIKCSPTEGGSAGRLVWSYPLRKHVLSTPAVADGLVFIADCGGVVHCLDAETGKALWTGEIAGEAWASPMVADGKVYLGTRSGKFYVFALAREKKVLGVMDLGSPISGTVTAANGTLYLATMRRLYALSGQ